MGRDDRQQTEQSYIVINKECLGSSWLQEILQMHQGLKVVKESGEDTKLKCISRFSVQYHYQPCKPDTHSSSKSFHFHSSQLDVDRSASGNNLELLVFLYMSDEFRIVPSSAIK
jgi:hypothetical protein